MAGTPRNGHTGGPNPPDYICPKRRERRPFTIYLRPEVKAALLETARRNGTTMQDSSTSNQIFGVAEVISFVSQAITLEPGDLIITGTPAGVGAFRKPPVWLQPGDEITIEIDGLGSITKPVVAGD